MVAHVRRFISWHLCFLFFGLCNIGKFWIWDFGFMHFLAIKDKNVSKYEFHKVINSREKIYITYTCYGKPTFICDDFILRFYFRKTVLRRLMFATKLFQDPSCYNHTSTIGRGKKYSRWWYPRESRQNFSHANKSWFAVYLFIY